MNQCSKFIKRSTYHTRGISGGGSLEHVEGFPVTKGCFEACMHIISLLELYLRDDKIDTVEANSTSPSRNQSKLIVFDSLLQVHDKDSR